MSLEKEFVPADLNQKLIDLGLTIEKPLMFRRFNGELSEYRHEYYTTAILWQQAFDFLLKKSDKGIRIWHDGSGAICSWKDESIDLCFNTKEEALYLLIEDYEKTCKSEN